MSELADYVIGMTQRGECTCGKCCDKGTRPDPEGHTADVVMFKVSAHADADATVLRSLAMQHVPEFASVDVFDGKEHSYIELGAWIGDQGVALRFMALGKILGLWELLTPHSMFGDDLSDDLVQWMAGGGIISVKAAQPTAAVPD